MPSRSSILVYRGTLFWYNADINPSMGIVAPEIYAEIGINNDARKESMVSVIVVEDRLGKI